MALIGRWRGRSLLAPPLLPRLQLLWVLLLSQEFSFRPSGWQGRTHSPWHDKVGNKKELNPDGQDDGRVDRQGFTLFLSPILSFPLLLSFFPFMCHFSLTSLSFLSCFLTLPLPSHLIPSCTSYFTSSSFLSWSFFFHLLTLTLSPPFPPSFSNTPFLLPHFLRLTTLQPHFLREDCSVHQTVRWLYLHTLWSEFVCRPAPTS